MKNSAMAFRHLDMRWVLLALLLIASRVTLFELTKYTSDDAFTTYRYARNIAAGEGFVFNPGERVQGSSSPLYAFYLAGVAASVGSSQVPLVSRLTGLAADLVVLWLLWTVLRQFSSWVGLFGGGLFVLFPKVNLIGISGMEAPLVAMFMLLSWVFLQRGRHTACFLVCGCLLLTRLDSTLWVLFVLAAALHEGPFPWRSLAIPATLIGGWLLFAWLYFGSWIPQSASAKIVSWHHLFPAFDPLRVMTGYLSLHFSNAINGIVVVLFILPVVIDCILLVRRRSSLAVFPLFFLAYNLALTFGRIVIPDWYYYPGFVAYIVSVSHLLSSVAETMSLGVRKYAMFALVLLSVSGLAVGYFLAAPRWAHSLGQRGIEQNGRMGAWLRAQAAPGSRVLVEEIGRIGWESDLIVYDYLGLVSPHVVDYRRNSGWSDAWYMSFVRDNRPEYIVQRNWELDRNSLFQGYGGGMFRSSNEREWFLAHYRQMSWNPLSTPSDSVYLVLYHWIQEK